MKNFFRNLSIQTKLFTGFGIIVIIMMITGVREIALLNNLNQKRENTSNAVNTSYMLKESRFIVNSEITLLNELAVARSDNAVDNIMIEHLANRTNFGEIYTAVESNTRFRPDFQYNTQNKAIRDSMEEVRKIYQSGIEPAFERMVQAKKNLLNIDMFYAEYLRIQLQDTVAGTQEDSKEALSISLQDDITNILSFAKETSEDLTRKIQFGEQISVDISHSLENEMKSIYESKTNETFVFIFFALLISAVISFVISGLIIRPVSKLRIQIEELTGGKLPEDIYTSGDDEIGEMGKALGRLVAGLRETAKFSIEIGKGNFAAEYQPMSRDDVLGNSLLSMRDSLKAAKEDEEKRKEEDMQRSRVAEGLALFGDILRRYSDDIKALSDEIISSLVKFTGTNQGALFILNDEDKENIYLDLQGAYAYNRKKYFKKQIEPGIGLIGAVYLEKYTMYLTEVPENFVEIESGLGGENPKSILIVPLKVEEEVLGVVELASFSEFEPYEIELVERISESIASTLSTTRINARTARLLEQSKKQAVKMREQEEEMLQNIEELKATQEENLKHEKKLEAENKELRTKNTKNTKIIAEQKQKIEALNAETAETQKHAAGNESLARALMQNTISGILILDNYYKITGLNHLSERIWGFPDTQLIGKKFLSLLSEETEKQLKEKNLNLPAFDKSEITIKKRDGSKMPVYCSVSEFKSENRSSYIVQVTDISNKKEQEQKMGAMLEKALTDDLEKTIRIERLENILKRQNFSYAREAESDDLIHFGNDLILGINAIDQQHKKWVTQVNKLYTAIREEKDLAKIRESTRELIDYSDYHFSFEEKYLKEFDFIFYDQHIKHHRVFIEQLNTFKNNPDAQLRIEGIKLMTRIRKTVSRHIQEDDKKYISLFKENGLV